jgi:hypothetical protein
MHDITISQFKDDDDHIITTAATDPPGVSVAVHTTGAIIDVDVDTKHARKLAADELRELFITCAQAAFACRYDPLGAESTPRVIEV